MWIGMFLLGCGGGSGEKEAQDTQVEDSSIDSGIAIDTNVTDGFEVEATWPKENATGLALGTVIWVDLAETPPEEMTLHLENNEALVVAGETFRFRPSRIAFAPDSFLNPDQSYTVVLTQEEKIHKWSFVTGSEGISPITEASGGETFVLHFSEESNFNVISPAGGKLFVSRVFPPQFVQVSIAPGDSKPFAVKMGFSRFDEATPSQDMCQPTFDVENAIFSNPSINSAPMDVARIMDLSNLPMGLDKLPMLFHEMEFHGALVESAPSEFSQIANIGIKGWVDIREMSMGNVCGTMEGFVEGMQCEPCPGEPNINECLIFWMTDLTGEKREDVEIQDVTMEEVLANEECQ